MCLSVCLSKQRQSLAQFRPQWKQEGRQAQQSASHSHPHPHPHQCTQDAKGHALTAGRLRAAVEDLKVKLVFALKKGGGAGAVDELVPKVGAVHARGWVRKMRCVLSLKG